MPIPRKSRRSRDPLQRALAQRRTVVARESDATIPAPTRRNSLVPPLTIVERPIEGLKPAPRRVRRAQRKHVEEVAHSIGQFGYCAPVLITRDGTVIDGIVRVEAAKFRGIESLPCIVIDHLSDEQTRVLALALNRLQEKGEWDVDALKAEFEALIDFGVTDIPGFEAAEIDLVLAGDGVATGVALDPVTNAVHGVGDGPTVTRVGDIWQLAVHRVLCGDATDRKTSAVLMQDCQADLVFTDPPYNVRIRGHVTGNGRTRHREFPMASGEMSEHEFTAFLEHFLANSKTHLRPGALLYSCMDWRHLSELQHAAKRIGLEQINLCVWVKPNGGMGSLYRSRHELIVVFWEGSAPYRNNVQLGRFGWNRTNVWEYPGVNTLNAERRADLELHPTVKPVELVADVIRDVTRPGEVVLDPFLGSGTTVIAAEKTRRVARAIELDERYVDVVVKRWESLTGKTALHAATGLSFQETAERRNAAAGPRSDETEPAGESSRSRKSDLSQPAPNDVGAECVVADPEE